MTRKTIILIGLGAVTLAVAAAIALQVLATPQDAPGGRAGTEPRATA
ncbi:MAG: hypothetical protein GXY82_04625 [Methanospirillum sp.]|nr:hypothetical protein [Methanospirillum sp.]